MVRRKRTPVRGKERRRVRKERRRRRGEGVGGWLRERALCAMGEMMNERAY